MFSNWVDGYSCVCVCLSVCMGVWFTMYHINIMVIENRGTHILTQNGSSKMKILCIYIVFMCECVKGTVLKIAFSTLFFFFCSSVAWEKKNQFQYTMHMYWQPNNTLCTQKVHAQNYTSAISCYYMMNWEKNGTAGKDE